MALPTICPQPLVRLREPFSWEAAIEDLVAFAHVYAVALAPVVGAIFIASLFRRCDRLVGLPPLAVVTGFFVTGLLGWTTVPAQWTASFWTTLDASINAAKYGAAFEHTAERALLYFFFPAELGAIRLRVIAVFVLWRIPFLRLPGRWDRPRSRVRAPSRAEARPPIASPGRL